MPVQHKNVCVTPGVTVGIGAATPPAVVPRLDHDRIVSFLRERGGGLCGLHRGEVEGEAEKVGVGKVSKQTRKNKQGAQGSCIELVEAFTFAALRSRTPTSAGMLGLAPDDNQKAAVAFLPQIVDAMWESVEDEFGISTPLLEDATAYFMEDHGRRVFEVAEENARGQCTEGHSCKLSSKDLLQRYIDLRTEMGDGGFDP